MACEIPAAGEGYSWSNGGPAAAPFSGTVATVNGYNAATTAATLTITALLT